MNDTSSSISTHVLDVAAGHPAPGIEIVLYRVGEGGAWTRVGGGVTDGDGRVDDLLSGGAATAGTYLLTFETGAYFDRGDRDAFYPRVHVAFTVADPDEHYHVPVLLSPYGYTTYRGS